MAGQFGGYIQSFGGGTGGGGGGGGGGSPSSGGQLVDNTYFAAEAISGGKAVALTQSGTVQTAMASVSGRMPAVGIVASNYLSGANVVMFVNGKTFNPFWTFSGWAGQPAFVGASGDVVASGAPSASGNIQQFLGTSINATGLDMVIGDALEGVVAGSGDIGSGSVTGQAGGGNFCIASGTTATYDFASGATIRAAQFVSPSYSGTSWSLNTEETVSGVRAVCISQSGNVRIAMAAVSGRMPAVGIVVDNVLSGLPANIYTNGVFSFTSGLFVGISGFGQPVWVGRSGFLTTLSGWQGSGGYASGDIGQKMGVALAIGTSGGVLLSVNTTVWSGGPIGEATGGGIV